MKRIAQFIKQCAQYNYYRPFVLSLSKDRPRLYFDRLSTNGVKHRISFILFVVVAGWVSLAHGANYQEIYLRAHKQYKDGEYEKALELYASMPNKSTAVWYNSGNCLFHLGKYIDALVAFRRAEHGATHVQRKAIDYNIKQTLDALDISPAPVSYAQQWYAYMTRSVAGISLLFLQLIFLLLLYLLFFCMRRAYISKKYVMMCVLLTMFTCLSGSLLAIKYYDTSYVRGIVIRKQGSIFVGPDTKYDASGAIALADELTILKKRAEWYKVKKGKILGWVPAELVAEID